MSNFDTFCSILSASIHFADTFVSTRYNILHKKITKTYLTFLYNESIQSTVFSILINTIMNKI